VIVFEIIITVFGMDFMLVITHTILEILILANDGAAYLDVCRSSIAKSTEWKYPNLEMMNASRTR
jgi:hypothetical protein